MKSFLSLVAAAALAVLSAAPASAGVCNQNACSTRLMGVVTSGAARSGQPVRNATVKIFLITHELQPALAGDTALEGFVPRPTRGVGSWRRDRISG